MLLKACVDHLHQQKTDVKNVALEKVVASIFRYLLERPNFSTVLCESMRNSEINEGVLENLSYELQLSVLEKIRVGLALSDSENSDIRICGKLHL